jgi:hypothetical protein
MKKIVLAIATMAFIISCGQPAKQEKKVEVPKDSAQNDSDLAISPAKEKTNPQEYDYSLDSVRLDFAFKDAFKIAKKRFNDIEFKKEYEVQPDDSSYSIHVEIQIADLFADNQKYFLLRRQVPWSTYIDIYKIVNSKAEKILSREQDGMSYIRDTIFDVNGDGFKDFLVHWYPSSGCCRRNVYNVYLNQPDKGVFTSDYEFINPTFSPEERIIRGVEYGHPGEVGLYKYMWNGLNVDTIEFIYPDVNVKGKFIKTYKQEYRPIKEEGIILESVPEEYHKIESYEWFIEF